MHLNLYVISQTILILGSNPEIRHFCVVMEIVRMYALTRRGILSTCFSSGNHGRPEGEQMLPWVWSFFVEHLVHLLTFCVTILTFCQNTTICSP